jgi:hypothetical protein
MRSVGSIFRLRITSQEIQSELVPQLDQIIESWLKGIQETRFADPKYVAEITYLTEPFKMLIERIIDKLNSFGIIGAPIERSFGFGKTHTLIFLWHLFTSDMYKYIDIHIPEDVIKESLVLAMDYSSKIPPFTRIIEELKGYADLSHPIAKVKDPRLIQAVQKVLSSSKFKEIEIRRLSSDIAEIIAEVLRIYREEFGGRPRLLLLIDELGWSIERKMRSYVEAVQRGDIGAESVYAEIVETLNFLGHLYAQLSNLRYVSAIVIWVIAEQDKKSLKLMADRYQDNSSLYSKIKTVLEELELLAQRYSRGAAGTSLFELSYDPSHAIKIALHRVLKLNDRIDLKHEIDAYMSWLKGLAKQLNIEYVIDKYKTELKEFYPLSLGLTHLLMKLMNQSDIPATEFIRTVIYYVTLASERALREDPQAVCIGLKHLSISDVVQTRLLGDYGNDWVPIVSDLEKSLQSINGGQRKVAEIIVKYLLAKGLTANVTVLLFGDDRKLLERYGTSPDEIQIEILQTFSESEAITHIDKIAEVLSNISAISARIDEKEIDGKRLYFPSIVKTVYDKLASFILDERKNILNESMIPIYLQNTSVTQIFNGVRVNIPPCNNEIDIMFTKYGVLRNPDILIDEIRESQNKGHLALLIVPPWDVDLFREMKMNRKPYDDVLGHIINTLQNLLNEGKITKHLHIAILIPNLSSIGFKNLLEDLVVYEGTKKFLKYLDNRENIISERLGELEKIFIKRQDILSISKEVRQRQLKIIQERALREINDARDVATKQLIRLSRELVSKLLKLYSKAIFYSIDKNEYVAKEIYTENIYPQEGLGVADILQYAAMVNKFLESVIRDAGFVTDVNNIRDVILNNLKEEITQGILTASELDLAELIENVITGTYKVKPLCKTVAEGAVRMLSGAVLELDDRKVTFKIEQNKLRINIELKTKAPEIPPQPTESEPTPTLVFPEESKVDKVTLTISPEQKMDEFLYQLKLFIDKVLREEGVAVTELKADLEGDTIELSFTLKRVNLNVLEDSIVKGVLNVMARIKDSTKKSLNIKLTFSNNIKERIVIETLGKYYKKMRGSFDIYLPA